MSILLTDKHVERAVTLLALSQTATNPVEWQRYHDRFNALMLEHPEVQPISWTDPRVEAKVREIREAFEPAQDGIIEAYCSNCGYHTGKQLASNREPIYCHACSVSRMFKEAAKR